MDGNGRWAKQRNLPRIEGHKEGAHAVQKCMKAAQELGIQYLTLFAFSVENWNRPKEEIQALMNLLDKFLDEQMKYVETHKIRLRILGRYHELPLKTQENLRKAEAATAQFSDFTVCIAINYGARTEIIDAIRQVAKDAEAGKIDLQNFNYENLSDYLYTSGIPDPDFLIRTSGESRLSNFLLLQAAYSEIYLSPLLWPEFDGDSFNIAIEEYASRERRYGKTSEQINSLEK
jgi:undecaprenyl diphosphate synthase